MTTTYEALKKHRRERNRYEVEHTQMYINVWLKKYRPNAKITFNSDEWGKIDAEIDGHKVEIKSRWLTKEMVEQYKKDGFVLSTSKVDGDSFDVLFYFLPIANEALVITHDKIVAGIQKGDIKREKKEVVKYQFARELGKKQEELLYIPYSYFNKYEITLNV